MADKHYQSGQSERKRLARSSWRAKYVLFLLWLWPHDSCVLKMLTSFEQFAVFQFKRDNAWALNALITSTSMQTMTDAQMDMETWKTARRNRKNGLILRTWDLESGRAHHNSPDRRSSAILALSLCAKTTVNGMHSSVSSVA